MSRKRAISIDDSDSTSSSESDASEKEEEYHVEVITKAKVVEGGKFEYLVKWYGYSSDDDTWEPEANVLNCEVLLKKFWKHVPGGKEQRHNPGPSGKSYEADKAWIDRERKFFKESMDKEKEIAKRKKEEKERQRKEALARSKHKPQKSIKIIAKNDAPSRERQAEYQDVRSLFANEMEVDKPPIAKAKTIEENKTKSKAKSPVDSREAPIASTSKMKNQINPIMPPPIQTAAVQRSKLAGLKIPKKSAISAQATPVAASPSDRMNVDNSERNMPLSAASPTVPGRPNPVRHPNQSAPVLRQINTTTTPVFTSNKPSSVTPSPVAPAGAEDVDNFMATVISFNDSISQKPGNLSQSAIKNVPPSAETISVDKDWKWKGNLSLDTADATQRLCDISVSESYNVADPGFRLGIILGAKDTVRFSKVYDRFETNSIVSALKKVDQIARISHAEEKDREPFTVLVNYLKAGDLVMAAPVITDYGHVAQMIVFPSPATKQTSNIYPKPLSQHLFQSLDIPSHYLGETSLIVVLMPWTVKPSQYTESSLRPDEYRQVSIDDELRKMQSTTIPFKITPQVERAIRILGFPEWFLSFMLPVPSPGSGKPTPRTYCVWAYPVEPMPRDTGRDFSTAARRETRSLLFLLDHLGAQNVGHKADVRVVFVHVGALRTINRLPALGDRRGKRPDIQFISYGSHESVKPIYWGFDQIFPLGGVVSLSFTALLENPVAVADLVEKISSHALWSCYVLPSVLSIFVGIACPGEDAVATYKQEPWRLDRILTLIDEGKLALMQSPPVAEQTRPGDNTNPREEWIAAQYACASKCSIDIVADAWALFKSSNMDSKTTDILKRQSEADIVKDLIDLQMQPYMRKTYRRFVVLKAMQDTDISFDRDGFEWRTVQDFTFTYDYNAKPSVEPSLN